MQIRLTEEDKKEITKMYHANVAEGEQILAEARGMSITDLAHATLELGLKELADKSIGPIIDQLPIPEDNKDK